MQKQDLYSYIDQNAKTFCDVSDAIWEYAELSLLEYKSAALYEKVLEEGGFAVEKGICGIETAFKASYGHGKPVIGILAEYDALASLSQKAGQTTREELVKGGAGHGCNHNILGAGSLAAAFAVKHYLEQSKTQGTVVFYGCPGEEGGASKAFMGRERLWEELDAALTWHPEDVNEVQTGSNIACIQTEYKYTGIAAHAAGDPDKGRSALDAVELMNIGVQFLREHMEDSSRIHYAITDAGGVSPNVVQPTAQVLYMVRADTVAQALLLQARVDKIALAAAMMTETQLSQRFIDGTANTVPNNTLEKLLYKHFKDAPLPTYTAEEEAFMKALVDSYESPRTGLPGTLSDTDEEIAEQVRLLSHNGKDAINNFVMPYKKSNIVSRGSTDVGDVSWLTPTAQIATVCRPSQCPGHSWQNVSCGKTSIAHKGLLLAGKVLACAAVELFEDPALLREARAEFEKKTVQGYQCPVPEGAKPTAVGTAF